MECILKLHIVVDWNRVHYKINYKNSWIQNGVVYTWSKAKPFDLVGSQVLEHGAIHQVLIPSDL